MYYCVSSSACSARKDGQNGGCHTQEGLSDNRQTDNARQQPVSCHLFGHLSSNNVHEWHFSEDYFPGYEIQ